MILFEGPSAGPFNSSGLVGGWCSCAIIEWVPLANIPEMIKRGEVAGSGALVGLLRLLMERLSEA